MSHVSARGIDECMMNVHYYYHHHGEFDFCLCFDFVLNMS